MNTFAVEMRDVAKKFPNPRGRLDQYQDRGQGWRVKLNQFIWREVIITIN